VNLVKTSVRTFSVVIFPSSGAMPDTFSVVIFPSSGAMPDTFSVVIFPSSGAMPDHNKIDVTVYYIAYTQIIYVKGKGYNVIN
jgi:hypothetical protein